MAKLSFFGFLFFLLSAFSMAAQPAFSLEQVLSAPFPSGLAAAPAGDRLAWVFNREGERNVWMAEGPAWQGRALTAFRGDDGQEIGSLCFSADGQRLFFVRGGAPNRSGESPNPALLPDGAKRQLWMAAPDGAEPRLIGDGYSPAPAPQGNRLAFINRGQIWIVDPVQTGATAKQLLQIRGGASNLNWSPDGQKLAFVSNRGDHALVGIVELESRKLRYLSPSLDNDAEPVWSPDGRRLAWMRFPREKNIFPFIPRPEGLPWSILVGEVENGQVDTVWTAAKGPGSAYREIYAPRQLFWSRSGHLVFPYEGDGWTHLWSVSAAGGTARCLTPGEFEVQYVNISPDGSSILYTSNEGDIDRQHLWRVSPAAGAPQLLTPGKGIEWEPVMTAGSGQIAVLASGARQPAFPARLGAQGKLESLAPGSIPAVFPTDKLVEPEQVIYTSADGMSIHGQLFRPRNVPAGRRLPALIFLHGGSRRQMLLGFHQTHYYHQAYAMNQYLASQGYVVLVINFRSGIGYGLKFREAENYGADGASEFNDVLGAGLYLRNRPDVDAGRIGLWGGSYGGYLTAMGLSRASSMFAAGVDIHGVHDWNPVMQNFKPDYDTLRHPEIARRAYASSPMSSVNTWRSPVLIIHGDDDRNVPISESVDLIESLRRQGVYFEQLIFPDEVHGFLLHQNWRAAFQATADFFRRKL